MSRNQAGISSGELLTMLDEFMDKLMTVTAVEPVEIKQSSPANTELANLTVQRVANLNEAERVPMTIFRLK